jgi:hypothetical protein
LATAELQSAEGVLELLVLPAAEGLRELLPERLCELLVPGRTELLAPGLAELLAPGLTELLAEVLKWVLLPAPEAHILAEAGVVEQLAYDVAACGRESLRQIGRVVSIGECIGHRLLLPCSLSDIQDAGVAPRRLEAFTDYRQEAARGYRSR